MSFRAGRKSDWNNPRRRRRSRDMCAAVERSVAPSAEPLEPRLLMAAALKLGGSGYSGTLSTNPATRQQQLICDPVEPLQGSTSVEYDPKLVHLNGLEAGPGYALQAFVEVVNPSAPGGRQLVSFAEYLRGQFTEAGYVQVKYQLTDPVKDPPGQITPPRENVILDEEGVDGIDTHALHFQPLKEVTSDPQIRYRVFAAGPNTHSGNSADFLVINDGTSNTITFDELDPADITTAPEVGSIAGRVLEDVTDDGQATPDDKPIEKVTVFLDLDRDGKLDDKTEPTDETDENGNFLFLDLAPGSYDVMPVPPTGYFKPQSYPKEVPVTVNVVKGRRTRGVDFGYTRPATLNGTAFADRDGDGVRDAGEPGLPGTTVYVDANGNGAFDTGERSDLTDANGAWSIGSLHKGTYVVRFNPPVGYTRTAPGGTAGFAYTRVLNPGDNATGLVFGARGIADLSITKTDGQTNVAPGQTITYTINVSNPLIVGAATATVIGARVVDTVPAALTNVSWSAVFAGAGSTGNAAGAGNAIDELITLAPGGTATYTVTGTLSPAATGTLTNTATVTAPATVVEGTTANNSASDTDTLAPRADLQVTLSDAPDPVYPNGVITYTINLINNGPSNAQNVALTLPATNFVSASAPAGWATATPPAGGSGNVTFTPPGGTVAPGQSVTFTAQIRLSAGVGPGATFVDTAQVTSSTTDPNPANNAASASTNVVAQPPRVTRVFVNGTGWSTAFRSYLGGHGLGDSTYGFDVGSGAASQSSLPWANLNQVSIRFDLPANVGPADLSVRGNAVAAYSFTGYAYDFATNTATWTLNRTVPLDRLLLDLNGDAGGVTEFTGQSLLDGESVNNALPSGNGAPGGDFRFRLNVLPGDANRNGTTDVIDAGQAKQRTGASAAANSPNYSPFYDFNTSGTIDVIDAGQIKQRTPSTLTGVPLPAAALFGVEAIVGGPASGGEDDELAALLT